MTITTKFDKYQLVFTIYDGDIIQCKISHISFVNDKVSYSLHFVNDKVLERQENKVFGSIHDLYVHYSNIFNEQIKPDKLA